MTLASVGAFTILRYPLSFLWLLISFSPLSRPLAISLKTLSQNKQNREGSPAWAIITGPTGGIGKEFSLQLARAGFSVLLVGRSQEKLDELAKEIRETANDSSNGKGSLIETHRIDLGSSSEEDWTSFDLKLRQISDRAPISMIINNAGISHSFPVPFESTPISEIKAINAVNVISPLRLTHTALPYMIKNRRGLILNLGSFSALVPTPLLATYAGSKGFLYTWSQALGTELEPKGIQVRLLNTYFVASEMSKIKRPSFLIPSPKQYVRSVLKNLGLPGGAIGKSYISTTYLSHGIVQWIIDRFFSESFWLNYNLRLQRSILKRVERKKLREQQQEKSKKVD
ncbi:hypothetical protein BY996DRAFT_4573510 [Phakopsora pachyrhizi]|uniref:Very-long-chain 3-oxoacyl-CoA reductase n=2 Tax=Phakopsora pachyrhizi TaxID=170000 RepID=A0AAV0B947_PHAPC|nr:hypothetical protein BY996DRAFT_4573510 [Phakopsora pachyrhizi]CAH7682694.1 hypothetical protein PPACK8108_LOCUS15767 [Phakopsora pachyrhizi]